MTVVAIVQARMGSTRLPGKVARQIFGSPMLARQLTRLSKSKKVDSIIVATSTLSHDDKVFEIAKDMRITVFRGDERDVLDRYYQAAREAKAGVVVRITGDCPLHDPAVVDAVVQRFKERGVDYTLTPSNLPEGLDTEVFSFAALERAWREARLPSEREHVTPYIRNHPELFKIDERWTLGDSDHSMYHWSVDTEQDFEFVSEIYERLSEGGGTFHVDDIIEFLEKNPELLNINKGGTGFEGLEKSKREDEAWKALHE